MIKTSFTVSYRLHRVHHTVIGVTSIVPNLNGFLFFTEDGQNHFVEASDLVGNSLPGMYFEYSTEEDLEDEYSLAKDSPEYYKVHDHRKK